MKRMTTVHSCKLGLVIVLTFMLLCVSIYAADPIVAQARPYSVNSIENLQSAKYTSETSTVNGYTFQVQGETYFTKTLPTSNKEIIGYHVSSILTTSISLSNPLTIVSNKDLENTNLVKPLLIPEVSGTNENQLTSSGSIEAQITSNVNLITADDRYKALRSQIGMTDKDLLEKIKVNDDTFTVRPTSGAYGGNDVSVKSVDGHMLMTRTPKTTNTEEYYVVDAGITITKSVDASNNLKGYQVNGANGLLIATDNANLESLIGQIVEAKKAGFVGTVELKQNAISGKNSLGESITITKATDGTVITMKEYIVTEASQGSTAVKAYSYSFSTGSGNQITHYEGMLSGTASGFSPSSITTIDQLKDAVAASTPGEGAISSYRIERPDGTVESSTKYSSDNSANNFEDKNFQTTVSLVRDGFTIKVDGGLTVGEGADQVTVPSELTVIGSRVSGVPFADFMEYTKGGDIVMKKDTPVDRRDEVEDAIAAAKLTLELGRRNQLQQKYNDELKTYWAQKERDVGTVYGLGVGGVTLRDVQRYAKVASDFSGYSSLFMSDEALASWRQGVDRVFRNFEISGWAEAMCKDKIKSTPTQTGFVRIGQNSVYASASANAECVRSIDLITSNATNLYKITIAVKNPQSTTRDVPMKFNAQLTGSKTVNMFNEQISLERGENFTLSKSSQVKFSNQNYTQICLQFEEPPEFFNTDTICNPIKCVDSGISAYDEIVDFTDYIINPPTTTSGGSSGSGSVAGLLNPDI